MNFKLITLFFIGMSASSVMASGVVYKSSNSTTTGSSPSLLQQFKESSVNLNDLSGGGFSGGGFSGGGFSSGSSSFGSNISTSSISSGVSTNPASFMMGSRVVGAACGSTLEIASREQLISSTDWLNDSFGTQISNATNILADVISSEIEKASRINTETLTKGQAIQNKEFEAQVQFSTRVMKDADKIATDRKISEDYDISSLNKTNVCSNAGIVHRQKLGESVSQKTASSIITASRNYNRTVSSPTDIQKIHGPLYEDKKKLDDVMPISDNSPVTLTEEQLADEIYANSLLLNPSPAPELINKALEESALGKQYIALKAIHDKKIEMVSGVLHLSSARKAATIDLSSLPDEHNLVKKLGIPESFKSGYTNSKGEEIVAYNVVNDHISPLLLESLQVKQYHENPEWQRILPELNPVKKTEEMVKINALNLQLTYQILQELRVTNKLLVIQLQKNITEDSAELTKLSGYLSSQ